MVYLLQNVVYLLQYVVYDGMWFIMVCCLLLMVAFTITVCGFHMGHIARKPVFRLSDKERLKPFFSATETSLKFCS